MTRATIQVPRPCAEDWARMTPTAQGRYCAACQHAVTDFTRRTDAEILALLRQAAGGRVCGRFRAEQLSRELVHAPAAAPRWRAWLLAAAALWGVPAAAQSLRATHSGGPVPVGGGAGAAPTEQLPVSGVQASPDAQPDTASESKMAEPVVEIPVRRITGMVVDQHVGVGIPGVTVTVKGAANQTYSGADGSFELHTTETRPTLVFSSIGYENKAVLLPAATEAVQVDLCVDMSNSISGLVVTVPAWSTPRGLWFRLRALPRRLTGRW